MEDYPAAGGPAAPCTCTRTRAPRTQPLQVVLTCELQLRPGELADGRQGRGPPQLQQHAAVGREGQQRLGRGVHYLQDLICQGQRGRPVTPGACSCAIKGVRGTAQRGWRRASRAAGRRAHPQARDSGARGPRPAECPPPACSHLLLPPRSPQLAVGCCRCGAGGRWHAPPREGRASGPLRAGGRALARWRAPPPGRSTRRAQRAGPMLRMHLA